MRKFLTACAVVVACAIPTAAVVATADMPSAGGFGEWPTRK